MSRHGPLSSVFRERNRKLERLETISTRFESDAERIAEEKRAEGKIARITRSTRVARRVGGALAGVVTTFRVHVYKKPEAE